MPEQNSNIYYLGNSRFTVITANCIRMEYDENRVFIDNPSWFAINRDHELCESTLTEDDDKWTIQTEKIILEYSKPGERFSSQNLTAKMFCETETINWSFGMSNPGNLGGTLQTLDSMSRPAQLPEGIISRDGWYCLDDSNTHLFADGWIVPRPENSGSDFYFFAYGNDYKLALQTLTKISGNIPLPRKCIFGSWYSRWHAYTSDDYMNIVREFDEHNIPLDIMVMDMDWHDKDKATHGHGWAKMLGWSGWSWNRNLIKDPGKLLEWFHEQGLSVTLNVHPHDGIREHEDCYEEFMQEVGKDAESPLPFMAGDKKYLDAYLKIAHGNLEAQGVDFWWVDWQQDSIMPEAEGIKGMKHLPLLNHAYFKFSERTDKKRGLGFSRWAGWGDQRYPIHFSGDAASNWDMLAFEIYFTATASNVGCFFWSHDIGGFHSRERDPELYARWVQFGVTTAAMRMHSTGEKLDRRPWKWGDEVEESIRQSFFLRSRLMPYIYSQAAKSCRKSLPLCRPLYYDFPESENSYRMQHQYLFGDAFMVAPVISKREHDNMSTTDVWLPEGEWANWFTREIHQGNQYIEQRSDINSFPLFVKTGYPIITQTPSLRMTTAKLDTLHICIYTSSRDTAKETELYEDDGISQEYKAGAYAATKFKYLQRDNKATLSIIPGHNGLREYQKNRHIVLELIGDSNVTSVSCGNSKFVGEKNCLKTVFDLGELNLTNEININW